MTERNIYCDRYDNEFFGLVPWMKVQVSGEHQRVIGMLATTVPDNFFAQITS